MTRFLVAHLLSSRPGRHQLEQLAGTLTGLLLSVATLPPDTLAGLVDPVCDEDRLVTAVRAKMAAEGHAARICVADDAWTARAAATWGDRDQVIPVGEAEAALDSLPLGAIDLSGEVISQLRSRGVRTVGALRALPVASLTKHEISPEALEALARLRINRSKGSGAGRASLDRVPLSVQDQPSTLLASAPLCTPERTAEEVQGRKVLDFAAARARLIATRNKEHS